MYLFIDTETTDLLHNDLPLSHSLQPHIVQLAAWLGEDSDDGDIHHVASLNHVIKPDRWAVPVKATHIHGITHEYACAFGEVAHVVFDRFLTLVDQASRLIAHNVSFDARMLMSELARLGYDPLPLNDLTPFCTMRALTSRCRLPSRRRGASPDEFKWPTLDEAYRFVFEREVPGDRSQRHDAMEDLLACRDLFVEGRRRGWWQ